MKALRNSNYIGSQAPSGAFFVAFITVAGASSQSNSRSGNPNAAGFYGVVEGDGDGGQVGVDKKPVQTENNLANHTELQNADLNAKINSSKTVSYERPSQFRKGVRDKVWENAKSEDGRVYDPLTHKEMDQSEPWDMGHKKGYEFKNIS